MAKDIRAFMATVNSEITEEEKEAPLLPAIAPPYTAPPQSVAVEVRSKDEKPKSHDEAESPFCSKYLVFFFLGIFVYPLFLVFGMLGLESKERHKIWAGRASAVVCIIVSVLWTVIVAALIVACILLTIKLHDEKEDNKFYREYYRHHWWYSSDNDY